MLVQLASLQQTTFKLCLSYQTIEATTATHPPSFKKASNMTTLMPVEDELSRGIICRSNKTPIYITQEVRDLTDHMIWLLQLDITSDDCEPDGGDSDMYSVHRHVLEDKTCINGEDNKDFVENEPVISNNDCEQSEDLESNSKHQLSTRRPHCNQGTIHSGPFRLLDLPPELRSDILDMHIGDSVHGYWIDIGDYGQRTVDAYRGLRLTSRQIKAEFDQRTAFDYAVVQIRYEELYWRYQVTPPLRVLQASNITFEVHWHDQSAPDDWYPDLLFAINDQLEDFRNRGGAELRSLRVVLFQRSASLESCIRDVKNVIEHECWRAGGPFTQLEFLGKLRSLEIRQMPIWAETNVSCYDVSSFMARWTTNGQWDLNQAIYSNIRTVPLVRWYQQDEFIGERWRVPVTHSPQRHSSFTRDYKRERSGTTSTCGWLIQDSDSYGW